LKKNNLQLKQSPDKYSYDREFFYPTEVFCQTKYKNYYVRGQILEFPYPAGFHSEDFYYRLYLLVLVSPSFDNTKFPVLAKDYRFGKIFGKTKTDFQSIKPSLIKNKHEKMPPSCTFKLKDFGIVENDYLRKGLSQEQDMVLVSVGMDPAGEVGVSGASKVSIYPFIANYFGFQGHFLEEDIRAWFSHFYDTLCFEFDYKGISKKEFFHLLYAVGEFGNWAVVGDKIINDYIKNIYSLVEEVSDSQDPLIKFCFSFLDDMLEDLYQKKIIGRCALCGNAFIYDTRKRYCTLLSEGKNCGKSSRNKMHYARNREKLRFKKKEEMAEWRRYLKEKNVKKPPARPRKRL